MNILFISHFFPPENAGGAFRIYGLASQLVKRGHKVTVVTGMPNYPQRKIFEDYKGKKFCKEEINGITVLRLLFYVPRKDSFAKRIWHYITSMFALAYGGLKVNKPDVVIATSPPLFIGISGWIVHIFKHCPFIFDVRDIWPESGVAVGMLKSKMAYKLGRSLEKFLYRHTEAIIVVTRGFINYLNNEEAVKDKSKVFWVSNGVDIDEVNPAPYNEGFAKKYALKNKFVVMYLGNWGKAQGLEIMLNAADYFKEKQDIRFVLVGAGVEREKLLKIKDNKKLDNVIFIPNQPRSKIPEIISVANCCVIPLIKNDLFKVTIPSKLYETMAYGKPIILGVDGDARRIMEEAGAGLYFEPENTTQLIKNILKFYEKEVNIEDMSKNGRDYVKEYFSRNKLAGKLEGILKKYQ